MPLILENEANEHAAALTFDHLAADIHDWAAAKGFWNQPEAITAACRADPEVSHFMDNMRKSQKGYLTMSELGEHCESLRGGVPDNIPGISNETEELADAIIRILDYCGAYALPIGRAVIFKMAKNQKRPYQHGRKF